MSSKNKELRPFNSQGLLLGIRIACHHTSMLSVEELIYSTIKKEGTLKRKCTIGIGMKIV
ncbi:MAG: hypothetical protein WBD99_06395 [Thermodesulfobacteriota bacterium]